MIDHIWTLICAAVIIDQDTNNISIFSIIEQVAIPEKAINNKVIGIRVELVTLWVRTDLTKPAKGKSRVDLVAPNGVVIKSVEAEIDLSEYERLRSRGLFQGIPYNGEGVYRFVTHYKTSDDEDWQQAASIPLNVTLLHEEEQEEIKPEEKAEIKRKKQKTKNS